MFHQSRRRNFSPVQKEQFFTSPEGEIFHLSRRGIFLPVKKCMFLPLVSNDFICPESSSAGLQGRTPHVKVGGGGGGGGKSLLVGMSVLNIEKKFFN